jgi:hypothetical protein
VLTDLEAFTARYRSDQRSEPEPELDVRSTEHPGIFVLGNEVAKSIQAELDAGGVAFAGRTSSVSAG